MLHEKLKPTTADGEPRCQARLAYGSAWVSGIKQCPNKAKPDESLCGVHLAQHNRRIDRHKNT